MDEVAKQIEAHPWIEEYIRPRLQARRQDTIALLDAESPDTEFDTVVERAWAKLED